MGIGIKRSEVGGSGVGAARSIFDALTNFAPINKLKNAVGETKAVGDKEPLLSLDMNDDALLALSNKWQSDSDKYTAKIKSKQDENLNYYLGKQYGSDAKKYNGTDNMIFEGTETILPMISRQNPDPVAECPDDMIANEIMHVLSNIADTQSFKLKIRQASRMWMIKYLGCLKIGWNFIDDDIEISVPKVGDLILDPHGNFDGGEFTGKYIGEPKTETAEKVIRRFPDKKDEITKLVAENLGTSVTYKEWWTDEYVFWTLSGFVLGKHKNPHWNYQEDTKQTDDTGVETTTKALKRMNHFKMAKKPYSFIWMFNFGEQPHDETSLIEQARPLQDMVNKKDRQIDKNADDANNGWVFNKSFSQDNGAKALAALRDGGAIIAPTENINEAVQRFPAPPMPSYIIQDMYDKREQIRNIMGIRGSSAAGVQGERTVRGKIQIQQNDIDRLSPIVEQVEQTADYIYNYALQMVYVYYSVDNCTRKLGQEQGLQLYQYITNPQSPEVTVSVKEGSTIPQDPLIKRSEAVDLATAGLMDPLTMYERMDFPNPQEAAQRLVTFKMNPGALFGDQGQQQAVQPPQVAQQVPPQGTPTNPMVQAPDVSLQGAQPPPMSTL